MAALSCYTGSCTDLLFEYAVSGFQAYVCMPGFTGSVHGSS